MLSWLIALCLLALVLRPAVPPLAVTATVAGVTLCATAPADRAEDKSQREDSTWRRWASLPSPGRAQSYQGGGMRRLRRTVRLHGTVAVVSDLRVVPVESPPGGDHLTVAHVP